MWPRSRSRQWSWWKASTWKTVWLGGAGRFERERLCALAYAFGRTTRPLLVPWVMNFQKALLSGSDFTRVRFVVSTVNVVVMLKARGLSSRRISLAIQRILIECLPCSLYTLRISLDR